VDGAKGRLEFYAGTTNGASVTVGDLKVHALEGKLYSGVFENVD